MVSKRQKEAKKRYKQEHPDLFPKPDPTPAKDPSKKKKKKQSKFKKKKDDKKGVGKNSGLRKHPLRVPGMKPGESCYICKAKEHIAKHCPEKAQWEKNKICLLCRCRGHSLKNCPVKNDEKVDNKLCYNCGKTGHSLDKCPQPLQDGGTKFASCFICNEQGHFSKNCPKNTHGIYPKGGSCKICGGITHLARDCPNKDSRGSNPANGFGKISFGDDQPRRQVTKFVSGDDLEDDFDIKDTNEGGETKSKEKKNAVVTEIKNNNVIIAKKQGPKVVNFLG